MKVYVTPRCNHTAEMVNPGYHGSGETFVGPHVIVSSYGVCLDGDWIIRRDRRAKRNREPGHPWLTTDGAPWTTFDVTVEP